MTILNLNINSDISYLLGHGGSSGNDNNYIVVECPRKEIEYLVAFSNHLIVAENMRPYIRVKYDWKYGRRPKVIEVVGVDGNHIVLYKRVNMSNYDQYAVDLNRIKDDIVEQYLLNDDKVKCCLVFDKSLNSMKLEELMLNLSIDIDYTQF